MKRYTIEADVKVGVVIEVKEDCDEFTDEDALGLAADKVDNFFHNAAILAKHFTEGLTLPGDLSPSDLSIQIYEESKPYEAKGS